MAKRTKADWWYSYPDDRNRLIEEAREILEAVMVVQRKFHVVPAEIATCARRWLRETKP